MVESLKEYVTENYRLFISNDAHRYAANESLTKAGRKESRTLVVASLVIILLLGFTAFVCYPRMQVTKANLSVSQYQSCESSYAGMCFSFLLSGTLTFDGQVTAYIGGHGFFTLQKVSATLDGHPVVVGLSPLYPTVGVVALPTQLIFSVSGSMGIPKYTTSQLQLSLDGGWSLIGATLNIPMHLTAQETIQWISD